ncbi:hypothetical protein RIB2604_01502820 [Aspergillus luchuensis]|uniref:Uncharacterized protein n=1 Tax=Aspergillus kawachii TaxID=1069201 RepID=A0A146F943_ASPKA|nr:hypothetical protein RIB2604_01502820 [Aspergillus luchuensis]
MARKDVTYGIQTKPSISGEIEISNSTPQLSPSGFVENGPNSVEGPNGSCYENSGARQPGRSLVTILPWLA